MNPKQKIKEFLLVGGLIFSFVIGIVLLSSKKDLSITSPDAYSNSRDIFNLTPSDYPIATIKPTSVAAKNQDVPLKVLGSREIVESSYLYTELTSKGLISNVSSTQATILWLTEAPQQTNVVYGLNESQMTRVFFSKTPVYIHEAWLSNLIPNTLYYFAGHVPITESFTTAPALATPPTLGAAAGTISGGSGMCLVRLALSRSTEISSYVTTITENLSWKLPLTGLRTVDLSAYYLPKTSDTAELDTLCVDNNKKLFSGSKKVNFGALLGSSLDIKVQPEN